MGMVALRVCKVAWATLPQFASGNPTLAAHATSTAIREDSVCVASRMCLRNLRKGTVRTHEYLKSKVSSQASFAAYLSSCRLI